MFSTLLNLATALELAFSRDTLSRLKRKRSSLFSPPTYHSTSSSTPSREKGSTSPESSPQSSQTTPIVTSAVDSLRYILEKHPLSLTTSQTTLQSRHSTYDAMLEKLVGESDAIIIGALDDSWKVEEILFGSDGKASSGLSDAISYESDTTEVSEVPVFTLIVTPPTAPSSSLPTTNPDNDDPHFLRTSLVIRATYDVAVIEEDDDSDISETDIFFDPDQTYLSTPCYSSTLPEPTTNCDTSFSSYSTLYPDEEDDDSYFDTPPTFDSAPQPTSNFVNFEDDDDDDSYFATLPTFDDEIKSIPTIDLDPFESDPQFESDPRFIDFRAGRPPLAKKTLNPELRKCFPDSGSQGSLRTFATDNSEKKIARAEEVRSRSTYDCDEGCALDEHYEDAHEGDDQIGDEDLMEDYDHSFESQSNSDSDSDSDAEESFDTLDDFISSFVDLPALRKPFLCKRSGGDRDLADFIRHMAIYKGAAYLDFPIPILSCQQLELLEVTVEQVQRVHKKLAWMTSVAANYCG